jgi:tRNA (guanine26-N2/guanine27-N2)-dimethyltransferase
MSSHASAALCARDASSTKPGSAKPIPEGFSSISEGSASIIHETGHVFYNPAQVQNRDLSIACLNVFSKIYRQEKEARAAKRSSRLAADASAAIGSSPVAAGDKVEDVAAEYKGLRILEGPSLPQSQLHARANTFFVAGLSASGLRSIRYAKEIPDLDFVVANDMLPAGAPSSSSPISQAHYPPAAVESIQRNLLFNDIPTGKVIPSLGDVNKVTASSFHKCCANTC